MKTRGGYEKAVPHQGPTLRDFSGDFKCCPQCNRVERIDEFNYCTADGATLIWQSELATGELGTFVRPNSPLSAHNADTVRLTTLALNGAAGKSSPKARTTQQPGELRTTISSFVTLRRMGKRTVFGLSLIAILVMAAGWAYYNPSKKNNPSIGSLAVLPFLNVDSDQSLEYLSDGITDTLISNLSQLPNLNVKARSSVFRYKGKDVSARTVASDLNVQAILNGRFLQRGNLVTLSLELVDAQSENVLWSKQYSRKQTDLISLQSEIARDVSDKLRVTSAGTNERKGGQNYKPSEEAYELYLKGRFHWNKRTLPDLEKAIDSFNQAIALDPNYALANAGLADTYVVLSLYRDNMARDVRSRAREAAMKALSLDGDLAEAHATLGFVDTHEYDFVGAEREYKRAIELNPNYATAHQWYGELLSHLGRHEESLAELRRALEIDPFSLIINDMYGNSLFYARRYNDAIAQLKKTLELEPGFAITHQCLARVYQAKGSYADAAEEFARYQELNGELQAAAQVRKSFSKRGWRGFLRSMTDEQQAPNLSEYEKVIFLAALGDKESAFAKQDKAYEIFGCVLKVDPLLDPLRDDPRFSELLQRVGLGQ